MAVSAFCRKAELPLCIGAVLALYSSHGWTKQRIRIAFCPIRHVLVLEGSSPRQTLSGMWLAEAKLFRAC